MQPGLGGPDWRLHGLGQLDEGEVEKIVEQDGGFLGFGKGRDGAVDRFGLFAAKENVLSAVRGVLKVVQLFHGFNDRALALPETKQAALAGNGEKPAPESLVVSK